MTATEKIYDPDWRDRLWQRWHGVDVEGIIPLADMMSMDQAASARATFYQPIPIRFLKRILKAARKTQIPFRNFVDLGCGKGKAVVYMGRSGAFRRSVGVDIARDLLEIARHNRALAGGMMPIDFIETDAQRFLLPDGETLIFLFNPFDAVAIERFVRFNDAHFRRYRSVIAYAFDIEREALAGLGFETLWRDGPKRLSFHAMP